MAGDVAFGLSQNPVNASGTQDHTDATAHGGDTVKGGITFGGYATALDTSTDDGGLWLGAFDEGASQSVCVSDEHDVGTVDASLHYDDAAAFHLLDVGLTSTYLDVNFDSVIADGLRTAAPGTRDAAVYANVLSVSGADAATHMEAALAPSADLGTVTVTHNLNSTNYLVFAHMTARNSAGGSASTCVIGTGVATVKNGTVVQKSIMWVDDVGDAAGDPGIYLSTTRFCGQMLGSGNGVYRTFELENAGANSFDIQTHAVSGSALTRRIIVEVIACDDRDIWCDIIDAPNSAVLNWEVTGVGFKPQVVGLIGSKTPAVDTVYVHSDNAESLSYGVAVDHKEACSGFACDNDGDPTNVFSVTSDDWMHLIESNTGSMSSLYHFGNPTFESDGWTVAAADITAASATTHKFIAWAVEEKGGAAPSGTYTPFPQSRRTFRNSIAVR